MELSIQAFAQKTGLTPHTLRYYERIGLISPVSRKPSGQRLYNEGDHTWVVLLHCLRATGMPIAQMCRFAEMCRQGEHTIPDRVQLLGDHEREVLARIAQLQTSLVAVGQKIKTYQSMLSELSKK
jgi:DNA-binding transcriptional MerR regulator